MQWINTSQEQFNSLFINNCSKLLKAFKQTKMMELRYSKHGQCKEDRLGYKNYDQLILRKWKATYRGYVPVKTNIKILN